MSPAYACVPANALFFVAYIVVGHFLIEATVVAVAIAAFREHMCAAARARQDAVLAAIERAAGELARDPLECDGVEGAPPPGAPPGARGREVELSGAPSALGRVAGGCGDGGGGGGGVIARDPFVRFASALMGGHGVEPPLAGLLWDAAVRGRPGLPVREFSDLVLTLHQLRASRASRACLRLGRTGGARRSALSEPLVGAGDDGSGVSGSPVVVPPWRRAQRAAALLAEAASGVAVVLVFVRLSLAAGGSLALRTRAEHGVALAQVLLAGAHAGELAVRAGTRVWDPRAAVQTRGSLALWGFEAAVAGACLCGGALRGAALPDARAGLALECAAYLRVIRVLVRSRRFNAAAAAVCDVAPGVARYLAALGCIYFAYAMIGQDLFGGRLGAAEPAIAASPYGQNGFYAYNFDGVREALVTLFYAMVVNNWPIVRVCVGGGGGGGTRGIAECSSVAQVYEGCYAARGAIARLYFVSWFALTVLCVLPVFVAVIVEGVRARASARGRGAGGGAPREPWRALVEERGVDFSAWELWQPITPADVHGESLGVDRA